VLKKFHSIVIFLLGMFATALGGYGIAKLLPQLSRPPRSALEFISQTEIGFVEPNQNIGIDLPIRNHSECSVRVFNITSTCGCLKIEKDTENGFVPLLPEETIPPHGTLFLRATLSTSPGLSQLIVHSVEFETDLVGFEKCQMTITGKAILRLYAKPECVTQIQQTGIDSSTVFLIDARDPSRRRPVIAWSDHSGVRVLGIEPSTPPEGIAVPDGCQTHQLRLQVERTEGQRIIAFVRVQDDQGEHLCTIPVNIPPDNESHIRPSRLVFGNAKLGEPVTTRIDIPHLRSAEVLSKPDWVEVEIKSNLVWVRLLPTLLPKIPIVRGSVSLRLETDQRTTITTTLPISVLLGDSDE
jgi:hypothetical protein